MYACSVAKLYPTLCDCVWTVARQTPLSMRFPGQENWSGLPFPPPGDLSSSTGSQWPRDWIWVSYIGRQVGSLPLSHQGSLIPHYKIKSLKKPINIYTVNRIFFKGGNLIAGNRERDNFSYKLLGSFWILNY